jgi:hypothetical protein
MSEPTPECEACGQILTPEDVAKSDGVQLCPECYADLPTPQRPHWWWQPEAGEGEA